MGNLWHRAILHIVCYGLMLTGWHWYTQAVHGFYRNIEDHIVTKLEIASEKAEEVFDSDHYGLGMRQRLRQLGTWASVMNVLAAVVFIGFVWRGRMGLAWSLSIGMILVPFLVWVFYALVVVLFLAW